MLSLLELVTQNQPHFQTHQALLVLGLQNDFILPDGKLPVNTRTGFLDRIHALIPTFRKQSSNIIWTKTLYESDRLASDPTTGEGDAVVVGGLVDGVESSTDDDDDLAKDLIQPPQSRSSTSKHRLRALNLLKRVSARKTTSANAREELQAVVEEDEELFLRQSAKNGPACLPGTPGADFADVAKSKIEPSDTVVQTTNYSAFQGTSLLLILRRRLVTEVYICGCITNVNVLATVIDAARHGIRINVVGDCLGYRKQSRHKLALKRMVEFFDANIVTSQDVIARNTPGSAPSATPQEDSAKDEQQPEDQVNNSRVSEPRPTDHPHATHVPHDTTPTINNEDSGNGLGRTSFANSRARKPSDTSLAESRVTSETKLSDEQFADILAQGAKVARPERSSEKPNLVKSKIRMRPRTSKDRDKEKKSEDKKSRGDPTKRSDKGDAKVEASSLQATPQEPKKRENCPQPVDSVDNPRPAAITKAESSDKLRDSPSKGDRSLKPSASQPALSSASTERDIASLMKRMALSRATKPDSNEDLPKKLQAAPAQSMPPPNPSQTADQSTKSKPSKLQSLATLPVLGPDDRIAEGDSRIVCDFFPHELYHPSDRSKPLRELIFTQIYNEVRWQRMLHQEGEVPRLVCAQGEFSADGSMPIYRHPADQTLPLLHFSPKVQLIRKQAEKLIGHPLNHVLIQLYRSGVDCISEHSDKTLDIARGSSIVNVSFGAQRTMRLRTKKSDKADGSQRETQRVAMPHNSMFVLGPKSNTKWLHGIMPDKRIKSERSELENAYGGIRISLTFRHIATYLDAKCRTIWGQGATVKDQRDAGDVINDDEEENERLLRAFSRENHDPGFDWDHWYGEGFDVLHLKGPPKDLPILFASNNQVENDMVRLYLAERNMEYSLIEAPKLDSRCEVDRQVSFRDTDDLRTEVTHSVLVIEYLERYTAPNDDRSRSCTANSYDIVIMVTGCLKHWNNRHVSTYPHNFMDTLELLEERYSFTPGIFIAGRRFAHSDCITWIALDELIRNWEGWSEEGFPKLTEYYRMLWKKKKSVQMLRPTLADIKKSKPISANHRDEE